jgi:hypothetical protein
MNKEVHEYKSPHYIVFSIDPFFEQGESLVQQSNPFDSIEKARNYASNCKETCYIYKGVEQHYKKS